MWDFSWDVWHYCLIIMVRKPPRPLTITNHQRRGLKIYLFLNLPIYPYKFTLSSNIKHWLQLLTRYVKDYNMIISQQPLKGSDLYTTQEEEVDGRR